MWRWWSTSSGDEAMEMPKCCWKFTADWSQHLLNQCMACCHGVLPSQHHSTTSAPNHPYVRKTRHAAKSIRLTLDSRVRSPPRRSSRARALLSASRAFSSAETYRDKDDVSWLVQTSSDIHPRRAIPESRCCTDVYKGTKGTQKCTKIKPYMRGSHRHGILNMLRGHSQHWHNSKDKLCKS